MNHNSINLHSIETASKDELQSLQLERMQWTLKHAYENVSVFCCTRSDCFESVGCEFKSNGSLTDSLWDDTIMIAQRSKVLHLQIL